MDLEVLSGDIASDCDQKDISEDEQSVAAVAHMI